MKLEALVSTMYQQGYDLIKKMNIQSDANLCILVPL